jgi:hypothetical protein
VPCPDATRASLDAELARAPAPRLEFFASWCGECRDHLRAIDASVVLVAAWDTRARAEAALAALGVRGVRCRTDESGAIAKSFGAESVPFTATLAAPPPAAPATPKAHPATPKAHPATP